MKTVTLRPVELDRDFGQLAELFTVEQNEPTTESSLRADYEAHKERIIRLMVAEDERGELLGFNWMTRSRTNPNEAYLYVIVKPEHRGGGVGGRLYTDLELAAVSAQVTQLEVGVRDDCPKCRSFADRNGFSEQRHSIGMTLDLTRFDDRPYDATIFQLQAEGFQFTSMEALGHTEEAQRKLYALNDMTSSETPGSEGVHSWLDFADFQRSVCNSDWYKPAGQMLVIDMASGEWVGMSAITRFEGVDYAYNLHTGVDKRYRMRKLAQAVKVLALRFARDVLKVGEVRTNHNSQNDPMIAIDRKFGYIQTPGIFMMLKKIG
jgi:RimJ/RimL family protein N-acetyltransferase/GNAT superfamily N-acetyltransferase